MYMYMYTTTKEQATNNLSNHHNQYCMNLNATKKCKHLTTQVFMLWVPFSQKNLEEQTNKERLKTKKWKKTLRCAPFSGWSNFFAQHHSPTFLVSLTMYNISTVLNMVTTSFFTSKIFLAIFRTPLYGILSIFLTPFQAKVWNTLLCRSFLSLCAVCQLTLPGS